MKLWWALGLTVALLAAAGCAKDQVQYRADQLVVGQAGDKIKVRPPSKSDGQAAAEGPLYILHRWKEDDSLSFLAIYYAGRLEYQEDIEEANPELTFTGRLPAGTPVWIPEKIVRPEVKKSFTLVPKSSQVAQSAGSPLDRGVIHKTEGRETLSMIAAFYTGSAKNAEKVARYNPGIASDQVLSPGQEVFIPAGMVLKDLRGDLVFVNRPRPQGLPAFESSAVGESNLGEEDLKQEPATFDQVPPENQPGYKPVQDSGPRQVSTAKVASATKTTRAKAVKKEKAGVPHKGSSKHKWR